MTTSELSTVVARFEAESDKSIQLARENGIVVDMADWLTINRYAQKYGVSTQAVTNWVSRGVIPADCVTDLPELNDLRLVKDQPYR